MESTQIADAKICPSCAETIKLAARKCRFCGHLFDARQVEAEIAARQADLAAHAGQIRCLTCGSWDVKPRAILGDGSLGPWCPHCQKPVSSTGGPVKEKSWLGRNALWVWMVLVFIGLVGSSLDYLSGKKNLVEKSISPSSSADDHVLPSVAPEKAAEASLRLLAMQKKGLIRFRYDAVSAYMLVEPLAWKKLTHAEKENLVGLALVNVQGLNEKNHTHIAYVIVMDMTSRKNLANASIKNGQIDIFD